MHSFGHLTQVMQLMHIDQRVNINTTNTTIWEVYGVKTANTEALKRKEISAYVVK